MTNAELADGLIDLALHHSNAPQHIRELLDEHRPEYKSVAEEADIEKIREEFGLYSFNGDEIAKRIYNAEYGYHKLVGKCRALETCLDQIATYVKVGRAGR